MKSVNSHGTEYRTIHKIKHFAWQRDFFVHEKSRIKHSRTYSFALKMLQNHVQLFTVEEIFQSFNFFQRFENFRLKHFQIKWLDNVLYVSFRLS